MFRCLLEPNHFRHLSAVWLLKYSVLYTTWVLFAEVRLSAYTYCYWLLMVTRSNCYVVESFCFVLLFFPLPFIWTLHYLRAIPQARQAAVPPLLQVPLPVLHMVCGKGFSCSSDGMLLWLSPSQHCLIWQANCQKKYSQIELLSPRVKKSSTVVK